MTKSSDFDLLPLFLIQKSPNEEEQVCSPPLASSHSTCSVPQALEVEAIRDLPQVRALRLHILLRTLISQPGNGVGSTRHTPKERKWALTTLMAQECMTQRVHTHIANWLWMLIPKKLPSGTGSRGILSHHSYLACILSMRWASTTCIFILMRAHRRMRWEQSCS